VAGSGVVDSVVEGEVRHGHAGEGKPSIAVKTVLNALAYGAVSIYDLLGGDQTCTARTGGVQGAQRGGNSANR
jgi:hypothetical protein